MGACLLVEMLNGLTGCTGVPKAGDDEGAAEDRGATPRPVNMAPAKSLCLRRLLGLRFMAVCFSVLFRKFKNGCGMMTTQEDSGDITKGCRCAVKSSARLEYAVRESIKTRLRRVVGVGPLCKDHSCMCGCRGGLGGCQTLFLGSSQH